MYIVILGAGRIGVRLARQLIAESKDVALIDRNPDAASEVSNNLDCLVVNDEGSSLEALGRAGIQKADVFISVTNSDETNLIACGMVAAEYEGVKTIARVRNLAYYRTKVMSKNLLGIDHIINPEIAASGQISYAITHGARSEIMLFENTALQMRNIVLGDSSRLVGKSVKDAAALFSFSFLFAAVFREDFFLIPSGNTVLQAGDLLYVLSDEAGFEALFSMEQGEKANLNRILFVGGGEVTEHVIEDLLSHTDDSSFLSKGLAGLIPGIFKKKKYHSIHVIDKSYDICESLSARFPQILVTHADVTDETFQEEDLLDKCDLIVTATNNQELNLITAVYGKTRGVRKSLALVTRNSYLSMARNLDVDVTVCQNDTVVNSILKIIRKGNIKNVHALSGGKLEVIEFLIEKDSIIAGKQISTIKLPPQSLVIFISREGEDIIPRGNTVIHEGDHLVLITTREHIKKIENLI